jgi:hypothetical protein
MMMHQMKQKHLRRLHADKRSHQGTDLVEKYGDTAVSLTQRTGERAKGTLFGGSLPLSPQGDDCIW